MKKIVTGLLAGAVGAALATADDNPGAWAEKIAIKGDLRYRHESIDKEGSETRDRHRVRARLKLGAKPTDTLSVKVRLASGSEDPVSSNQTLGDSFSTKGFHLDRAYFDWHPEATPGLSLLGGKMANPFIAVKDLIWDGDLNPEGLAAKYEAGGNGVTLNAAAGLFWLTERKEDDDTTMQGGQAALTFGDGDTKLMVGSSIFNYDKMQGFTTLADSLDGFGNSVEEITDPAALDPAMAEVIETLYATDYQELEGFAQLSSKLGEIPVKLYANLVVNNEADSDDTGYLAGVKLGKAKDPGSFEVDYNYRELEKDAVVGAFCDSDSFGGGTDGKGSKLSGKYQVAKNWQFGVAYFINQLGLEGASTDYDRLQIDLIAKF